VVPMSIVAGRGGVLKKGELSEYDLRNQMGRVSKEINPEEENRFRNSFENSIDSSTTHWRKLDYQR